MTDSAGLEVLAEDAPQQPRKKKGVGFFLLLGVIGVLVVALALAGFYLSRSLAALNDISRDPALNPVDYSGRPQPPSPAAETDKAPINFVLLGTDERFADDAGRSDSLMVAHLSGDRKHLYLISFPRDLWVSIPGHDEGKINWAYSFGGAALTLQTLEQLTNTRMEHTVAIDFAGFIQLTETLGGITVNNPWDSGSAGYTFPKGEITIAGEEALAYVRERKSLPNGDLDRAYRQRTVVKAILKEILSAETLTNPVTFNDVLGKLSESLSVDESLNNSAITDLMLSLKFEGASSIRLMQAPIEGTGMIGDQAVAILDTEKMAELSQAMSSDSVEDYYQSHRTSHTEE